MTLQKRHRPGLDTLLSGPVVVIFMESDITDFVILSEAKSLCT